MSYDRTYKQRLLLNIYIERDLAVVKEQEVLIKFMKFTAVRLRIREVSILYMSGQFHFLSHLISSKSFEKKFENLIIFFPEYSKFYKNQKLLDNHFFCNCEHP